MAVALDDVDAAAGKAADLAIRLQKTFGGVGNARLPDLYVQAKAGLAQCERVDECKEWADKAEAIRSYARQAHDDALMKTAMRIKGRAVQRLGTLLEDLERAGGLGGRPQNGSGTPPVSQVRAAAGVSNHQGKQAQAVARFAKNNPERFETMVERETPATVTELAREGRKPAPKPSTAHLNGCTPKEFSLSLCARGEIGRMLDAAARVSPAIVVKTSTVTERARLRQQTRLLGQWMAELAKKLGRGP